MGFLYTHPLLTFVIGFVLFLVIMCFLAKHLSTKGNKTKKEGKVKTEKVKQISDSGAEQVKETNEDKKEAEEKPKDKKPEITQVFKGEPEKPVEETKNKDDVDSRYDRDVEFVNTSKNVAKFKSFKEKSEPVEPSTDDYGFVTNVKEGCEYCENKVKHFDHSRRLSKIISNDDFDLMYGSHLTEKYMNMNSNSKLNIGDEYQEKLYERTRKMIINSGSDLSDEADVKRSLLSDAIVEMSDDDEDDDDLKGNYQRRVDLKSLIVSQVVMKRINKK